MSHLMVASLLRLYPAAYRAEFAQEMVEVLQQSIDDARKRGVLRWFTCLLRESSGLVTGAAREHLSQRFQKYPWVCIATRRFHMRSEFRYPRAAVPMMSLIFAIIVFAIYKARSVQLSMADHLDSSLYTLPAALGGALLVAAIAGALGWLILHSLHRSGVHRLSEAQTWPEAK